MDEKKIKKPINKKRRIGIIAAIVAMILVLIGGCFWYLNDSYPPSESALSVIQNPDASVKVTQGDGEIIFSPDNPEVGLIFYPGAKVEYEAYAPLMECFARNGVLCVLLHMPYNFAVFDQNAADGIQQEYPRVKRWYIGGHSLGGAMAANYVSKHVDEYQGLLLLAAYSTKDLSDTNLKVISIYGSEDEVLRKNKMEDCKKNLPDSLRELEIEGGNHGYFGDYGEQKGDGKATIRRQEQIETTVDYFMTNLGDLP